MEILRDPCSPPVLISNAEVLEVIQRQVDRNEKELQERIHPQTNGNADGGDDGLDGSADTETMKVNRKKKLKKQKVCYRRRDWIQHETLVYLKSSPCKTLDVERIDELKASCTSSSKKLDDHQRIDNAAAADTTTNSTATGYSLTEAETIQVMNMMPQSVVDVHLLVTEAHQRIGDEDAIQRFLDKLQQFRKEEP